MCWYLSHPLREVEACSDPITANRYTSTTELCLAQLRALMHRGLCAINEGQDVQSLEYESYKELQQGG